MGLGEGDMIYFIYFRFNELPLEGSSVSIPSQTSRLLLGHLLA
jgi:hypothetical protein